MRLSPVSRRRARTGKTIRTTEARRSMFRIAARV
jgi:hypothetical protein